jgi:hypothetical protein
MITPPVLSLLDIATAQQCRCMAHPKVFQRKNHAVDLKTQQYTIMGRLRLFETVGVELDKIGFYSRA